jgi:hypothetical protein
MIPDSFAPRWVRGAMAVVEFRRGRTRSIELPDCEFAARERTPLIAIERRGRNDGVTVQGRNGEKLAARTAHARDIDLRRRDQARHRKAFAAGIGPGDGARQGAHVFRQRGIKACRPAQAVPTRVPCGARLARGRLRTAAGAAVPPAGLAPRFADHAGPGSAAMRGASSAIWDAGIFAADQGRRAEQRKGCEGPRTPAGCGFARCAHSFSPFCLVRYKWCQYVHDLFIAEKRKARKRNSRSRRATLILLESVMTR